MNLKLAFTFALVVACHATPVVTLDTGDACGLACTKLADAGCVEGEPTPDGVTCAAFCSSHRDVLPVACVLEAGSREAMQRCGVCE